MKHQIKNQIVNLGKKNCNKPIDCNGFFYTVPVPESLKKKPSKNNS